MLVGRISISVILDSALLMAISRRSTTLLTVGVSKKDSRWRENLSRENFSLV
jgi:hypothetical protein